MRDWTKEYEKIGNKPVRELTSEDRMVCFKYHLEMTKDNFGWALSNAEDCGFECLEELMDSMKSMLFDVEDKGVDIGSMN